MFLENQENPATDMDVIDWIVDNLIDQSRTRRNVLIKMKKLGLIFKAPTKKSTKAACNKNVFIEEEDTMIRELYDEHRQDNDCLEKILVVFDKKRNQQQIVQRMIYLGLIANKSEILPNKTKKNQKREENSSGEDSDGSDHNMSIDQKKKQIQVKKQLSAKKVRQTQLKVNDIAFLRLEVEESWKEAIEWVIESLKEAAEDFEEPSDDPDDAIPLVPFQESQKEALLDQQFQKLLESVGILAPSETESYWRIPATFHPDELNKRAGLLSGELTQDDTTNNNDNSDGDDDEVSDDMFNHWRKQKTTLVYNNSDSEDEVQKPLPPATAQKKILTEIQVMAASLAGKHAEAIGWVMSSLKRAAVIEKIPPGGMILDPFKGSHKQAMEDNDFKNLLIALEIVPPEESDTFWRISVHLSPEELKNLAQQLIPDDNTSNQIDVPPPKKQKKQAVSSKASKASKPSKKYSKNKTLDDDEDINGMEINTQQLKQKLFELNDSSDNSDNDNGHNLSTTKHMLSKRTFLDSSDEEEASTNLDNGVEDKEINQVIDNKKRLSNKRDRSEIGSDLIDEDDDEDEEENKKNASNKQKLKRIKFLAESSDDE